MSDRVIEIRLVEVADSFDAASQVGRVVPFRDPQQLGFMSAGDYEIVRAAVVDGWLVCGFRKVG